MSMRIIKDFDSRKFDEFAKRIKSDTTEVLVGYPSGPKEPSGISVAEVAAVHEYGYPEGNIPERSHMRTGIKEGRKDFIRLNKRNLKKVLEGTMTMVQALGQLGAMGVGKIQQKIRSGDFAPLKPETIRRKGSSAPLIDKGRMIQALAWLLGGKND